jgi:hypothetical protein
MKELTEKRGLEVLCNVWADVKFSDIIEPHLIDREVVDITRLVQKFVPDISPLEAAS